MNEFINDFKIYCETVEDTKGLEILKQNLFTHTLNLETFIDDCIEIDLLEASNEEIIQEAIKIEGLLGVAITKAGCVNTLMPRKIYTLIDKFSFSFIKDMLDYTITDCFEYLYTKKYPKDFYMIEKLEEDEIPKRGRILKENCTRRLLKFIGRNEEHGVWHIMWVNIKDCVYSVP